MKNVSQIVRVLSAVLIGVTFISTLAHAQQTNPNRLRPCPKPDYSKNSDIGIGFGTEKWTNCWGVVTVRGMVLEGEWVNGNLNGQGTTTFPNGEKYVGEFKDGKKSGQGTATFADGNKYVGEFWDDMYNGQGVFTFVNGGRQEGIWENNNFIREAKVNLPNLNNNIATNTDRTDIDRERQQLAEERRRLEEDKRQREQAKSSQRINLQVTHTQPTSDGSFFIEVKTNADTSVILPQVSGGLK